MKWWTSVLTINGKQIPFKLDTGTEVTVITKKTWEELGEPALKLSDKLTPVWPSPATISSQKIFHLPPVPQRERSPTANFCGRKSQKQLTQQVSKLSLIYVPTMYRTKVWREKSLANLAKPHISPNFFRLIFELARDIRKNVIVV